jgi:hypothetical protein
MRTTSHTSRKSHHANAAMRVLSTQPWQIIEYFHQRRESSQKHKVVNDLNPVLFDLLNSFKEQVLHIN